MRHEDFDDGLIHGHDWAKEGYNRTGNPVVADASKVNTPSSVVHDDIHHAE